MTAECKVRAAAVDVPTEGGCGVSSPFDYEYANATCHESKARGERQSGTEQRKREGSGLKDRQGVVGKREAKCFHTSFECVFHRALFRHWSECSVCLPCSTRTHNSCEH